MLIKRIKNFPKIHDLTELSRMVKAPSEITALCAQINPAYTATRYPDVVAEFDKLEVKDIIEYTEKVLEWTKKQLKLSRK